MNNLQRRTAKINHLRLGRFSLQGQSEGPQQTPCWEERHWVCMWQWKTLFRLFQSNQSFKTACRSVMPIINLIKILIDFAHSTVCRRPNAALAIRRIAAKWWFRDAGLTSQSCTPEEESERPCGQVGRVSDVRAGASWYCFLRWAACTPAPTQSRQFRCLYINRRRALFSCSRLSKEALQQASGWCSGCFHCTSCCDCSCCQSARYIHWYVGGAADTWCHER